MGPRRRAGAKIVLVEANSASTSDLMAAVQTAAKQANVVSMSWGGSEFQGETAYDTAAYFANPNVTFIAASGDNGGAAGAEWPAVSPYVVSVGGTTLSLTSSGTTLSETAWNASGSRFSGYSGSTGGASLYESAPSYQVSALGSSVTRRETPDVASDANPSTGLSVYDSVPGNGADRVVPGRRHQRRGAGMGRNHRCCRPGASCRWAKDRSVRRRP